MGRDTMKRRGQSVSLGRCDFCSVSKRSVPFPSRVPCLKRRHADITYSALIEQVKRELARTHNVGTGFDCGHIGIIVHDNAVSWFRTDAELQSGRLVIGIGEG